MFIGTLAHKNEKLERVWHVDAQARRPRWHALVEVGRSGWVIILGGKRLVKIYFGWVGVSGAGCTV